jgi:hypothetical protein
MPHSDGDDKEAVQNLLICKEFTDPGDTSGTFQHKLLAPVNGVAWAHVKLARLEPIPITFPGENGRALGIVVDGGVRLRVAVEDGGVLLSSAISYLSSQIALMEAAATTNIIPSNVSSTYGLSLKLTEGGRVVLSAATPRIQVEPSFLATDVLGLSGAPAAEVSVWHSVMNGTGTSGILVLPEASRLVQASVSSTVTQVVLSWDGGPRDGLVISVKGTIENDDTIDFEIGTSTNNNGGTIVVDTEHVLPANTAIRVTFADGEGGTSRPTVSLKLARYVISGRYVHLPPPGSIWVLGCEEIEDWVWGGPEGGASLTDTSASRGIALVDGACKTSTSLINSSTFVAVAPRIDRLTFSFRTVKGQPLCLYGSRAIISLAFAFRPARRHQQLVGPSRMNPHMSDRFLFDRDEARSIEASTFQRLVQSRKS